MYFYIDSASLERLENLIVFQIAPPLLCFVRHFCNDMGWFTVKDDKGWQKVMLCDHLWCLIPFYNTLQCSLLYLQPFLTFSVRPFATFLHFALFNTLPDCVAFSGTFHQTLFTWLVHHSFSFSCIILGWLAMRFTDVLCPILLLQLYLCFLLPPLPNRTESSLFDHTTVYWLIVPLVILVLTHISHILHWSLSPFWELCCTTFTDLSLTWTTFSDHFWVPYHYIYTLILPILHCKSQVTLSLHFSLYCGVCSVVVQTI